MKSYSRNEKSYEKIEIDAKAIKQAYDKRKKAKKHTCIPFVLMPVEIRSSLSVLDG
jgi:hypothetical protein